jgi:hypothetical protein
MIESTTILRLARPTSDLEIAVDMYCRGLGLIILGEFRNHQGFDGTIIGLPKNKYHLEFTQDHSVSKIKKPSEDNLWIFYIEDHEEWKIICSNMLDAGFRNVKSANPYWNVKGKTFEDPDGFRTVIQNAKWDI